MTPRVLVVEDELIIARNIERYLLRLGYVVTGLCSSSHGALESVREEVPDLVLMDIRIEGEIDGVSLAAILHRDWQIPVVYLSALMDEETLNRAKITEPFGYVVKPFSQRELHIAIEIALHKSRLERKIQDQEVLLQGLLETMPQGFCLLDTGGNMVYANRELLRLLGKSEASLTIHLGDYIQPPGVFDASMAQEHPKPFEAELVQSGGGRIPVIVTAQSFKDTKAKDRGLFVSITPLSPALGGSTWAP